MKWHTVREATPEGRSRANAVFNQVFASRVIPQDSKAMLYIDVHTDSSGATNDDEGPTYRLFPNGAIDVGIPEAPQPGTQPVTGVTSEYFVTMTVEMHVGIAQVQKRNFADTMDVVPGDTLESLYWRAWSAMADEHHFDSNNAIVLSWSATPNQLKFPPRKCQRGSCANQARSDDDYCDGHSSYR